MPLLLMIRQIRIRACAGGLCLGLTVLAASAHAQSTPTVQLVEKPFDQLSNTELSANGKLAMAINPSKWKHAETPNFELHYRRVTEAQKVAREVEYNLGCVAKALGAELNSCGRRSHVFVFEDEGEWHAFLPKTNAQPWASSFASRDDLYLNIRATKGGNTFDSETLAHETTHAVVARLYPARSWPRWLNEGFAEYMSGASVAARKHQPVVRHQGALKAANLSLDELVSSTDYPSDEESVHQFYQSSEKLVRFLMNELPRERFPKFIDAVIDGKTFEVALLDVYGDEFKDMDSFRRKYSRFTK